MGITFVNHSKTPGVVETFRVETTIDAQKKTSVYIIEAPGTGGQFVLSAGKESIPDILSVNFDRVSELEWKAVRDKSMFMTICVNVRYKDMFDNQHVGGAIFWWETGVNGIVTEQTKADIADLYPASLS